MKLSDLTAYAAERYHIEEEHKWPDFPGFSVLCSPDTGKWLALLMRQWDDIHGKMIEVCDIKCGREILGRSHDTSLSGPYRMRGKKWVGVRMGTYTNARSICDLFDRALEAERRQRFTIELDYRTPDKAPEKARIVQQPVQPSRIPKEIFEMIHLYDFDDMTFAGKCRNFYRQGKFMENFEDNAPHPVEVKHYYTTYHDLNITQLRAYFTWRTQVRKGKYEPVALSLAYMYLYELICGIGCKTPGEAAIKMREFEREFLDRGYGDNRMRTNLHQWMFDFMVVHGLDTTITNVFKYDNVLCILKEPDTHTDEEIFRALSYLYAKKDWQTPVVSKGGERGTHLFALVWRTAYKELFVTFFGVPSEIVYRPFSNAVYYSPQKHPDSVYTPNPCRKYICRDGRWSVLRYEPKDFKQKRLDAFIHETDLILRRHMKTGRYLREKESESWAEPYVRKALDLEEAKKKPKITINLQSLDRIREDAARTRDSLLTEEELSEEKLFKEKISVEKLSDEKLSNEKLSDEKLSDATKGGQPQTKQEKQKPDSMEILRMLLRGENVSALIKQNHLIPSVVTDEINEALFDEIGDSVLACEGNTITVVEDYRDDLLSLVGEK